MPCDMLRSATQTGLKSVSKKQKNYKFSSLRFTPAPSQGAPRAHPTQEKYQTPIQPPGTASPLRRLPGQVVQSLKQVLVPIGP